MNLIEYVEKECRDTVEERSFSAADALCLSLFSYLPLEGHIEEGFSVSYTVEQLCGLYLLYRKECESRFVSVLAGDYTRFFTALGRSARFSKWRVSGFVEKVDEEEQMQFCALTIVHGAYAFVSFRGTDSSLVGWKEDFNMSFLNSVPSQRAAAAYLDSAASAFADKKILVGGHSKGGNLALYAAAYSGQETRARLLRVWAHDPPGFQASIAESEKFRSVERRCYTYLPKTSIIGMMLSGVGHRRVIHTKGYGFFQHNPFLWDIADGRFIVVPSTDRTSRYIDRTLKGWLKELEPECLEEFFDTLYELVLVTEATDITDLTQKFLTHAPRVLERHRNLDDETKAVLRQTIEVFFSSAWQALREESASYAAQTAAQRRQKREEAYAPIRAKLDNASRLSAFSRKKK